MNAFKFTLKWAVISGAVLIVHRIALLVLEMDKAREVLVQQILLFLISIVVTSIIAIYRYKKANNSSLTLKKALQIGFLITIITTVLITIYDAVFLIIIEPDYYQSYYELNWDAELEHYISLNPEERTEETFQAFVKERNIDHFKRVAPALLLYGTISNLIISLIAGLIMRTKQHKIKN
ncbi:DUF4199 family protein [Flavobacteriaceae bacterium R38]|nr:DUF4199 family protein [Flavobacteriaceae bacterium R38]